MLLVVDVGNTNTVLGLFEGAHLLHTWRVSTVQRTEDEVGLLLVQLLAHQGVAARSVTGVAVCSVVPPTIRAIEAASRRYLGCTAKVIGAGENFGMTVKVDNPREVGPDRVVNAFAARSRHAPPFLIIDFGTATTFDAVDASGAWVGGAIAPGLGIAAEALAARTSRLPRVEPRRPATAIGVSTLGAMQSGLYFGYVGLVDGLARRCKEELRAAASGGPGGAVRVHCIATGGLAAVVGADCVEIDEVDEHLTLNGLRIWATGSDT